MMQVFILCAGVAARDDFLGRGQCKGLHDEHCSGWMYKITTTSDHGKDSHHIHGYTTLVIVKTSMLICPTSIVSCKVITFRRPPRENLHHRRAKAESVDLFIAFPLDFFHFDGPLG